MRKLKRSLAVLLVLVMAFAMVPFAGANTVTTVASFNDGDDVTPGNLMALDVLAAVDVLRGEDGNIYPQRTITRAEAATIVARVLLGPGSADQLPPGRTGFRDVDNVSGLAFASGAIAYLHERGIVIGIGDDLFDPQAPVTGAELATMFLRAVGFGVNGEYTGPRWQTNAVVDGMQWRILTGDADFTAPATREQVFRYAYNAMNSSNDTRVGLRFVNWSADRQAYVPILLQGIEQPGAGDGSDLMTIWRRIFEQPPVNARRSGTSGVPAASDIFARPAVRYTIGGLEIGTYNTAPTLSFTTFQSELDIRREIDQYSIAATVNGLVNGTNNLRYGGANIRGASEGFARRVSEMSGNGVLLELWVNSLNEIHTVSAIRTDISEVASVNAGRTVFTLNTITGDNVDGIRTAGYGAGERLQVDSLHPLFDEVRELSVGDRILVSPTFKNLATGEVGAVAMPEVVDGVLNSSASMVNFSGNTGSLTVDGTVYRRAQVLTLGARRAQMAEANTQVSLVLDAYGFIVDTHTAGRSTRQLLFVSATAQGLSGGALTPMVRGFWPDGSDAEVFITGMTALPDRGMIIHILGRGNDVTWVEAAPPLAALPFATTTSIQATVVSLSQPISSLSANHAGLAVGGANLRFADDARYFFWNANPATGNPRFAIRDRSGAVDNLSGIEIKAVVEYRVWGQAPVISALWIGTPATASINASNLIFVHTNNDDTGGSMHTTNIDGVTHQTFRAYNINGQPVSWNPPADWPADAAGWIAIDGDPNGTTTTSGWYTYRIDGQNRFHLTSVDNGIYTNFGIFTYVPILVDGLGRDLMPLATATNGTVFVAIANSTQFIDLLPDDYIDPDTDRYFQITDMGHLVRFVEYFNTTYGIPVNVSVVFDPNNAALASAVFIHLS